MKVGIIGAGQLAQMLAMSAYQIGVETLCFSESEDVPAARISPLFIGSLENPEDIENFFSQVDVVTFENENVDIRLFENYQQQVAPNLNALHLSQDRLLEKKLFDELSIPCAPYKKIDELEDLADFTLPGILKTRRFGYDGKGQVSIKKASQMDSAWHEIQQEQAIIEGLVEFDFEVSQVASRNREGEILFFPLAKNQHQEGILRVSTAPYDDTELAQQAQTYTRKLVEHLDYVGTLCCEFFAKNGQLYANEIAPRVHNSGHWSIEGASCSQFEAHLRAICSLHLPKQLETKPSAMINIIGKMADRTQLLHIDGLHFYDYGKEERPNRKLGHITVYCEKQLDEKLEQALKLLQ